jgi:DNA polymerase-3 subunit delta'
MVIIEPAEAMNRNAANSLLKTLEEPPPDTQIILVSHMPTLLPVTVRSRCQSIRFDNPVREIARQWLAEQVDDPSINIELMLALADNSPLEALEMIRSKSYESRAMVMEDLEYLTKSRADPVEVAGRWMKAGLDNVIPWLWRLLEDLIRLQCSQAPVPILNQDLRGRLEKLAAGLKTSAAIAAYDRLKNHRQLINGSSNVTPLTLLEEFTIQWSAGND